LVGLLTWAGVAVFGAFGAATRFRVDAAVSARVPTDFPIGTFVVNLSGAVPLGLLVGAAVPHGTLLVLGTGFLGGYTTFSTWMVESERLGEVGDVVLLLANLFLSLLLGFGLAALAWHLGHAMT
jgi:fluoride exporter